MATKKNKLSGSIDRALMTGQDLKLQGLISRGVADLPIKKLHDVYHYVEQQLLPHVLGKKGKESDEYKTFADILDVLLVALTISNRDEYLRKEFVSMRQLAQFYRERAQFLEDELQKYITLENLMLQQSLDHYTAAVTNKLQNQKK